MKKLLIITILVFLFSRIIFSAGDRYSSWSEILFCTKDYVLLRKVVRLVGANQISPKNSLVLIDLSTNTVINISEDINEVVISSDKNLVAFTEIRKSGLWVYNISQKVKTEIATEFGYSINFADDSQSVSYISLKEKTLNLHIAAVDGKKNEIVYTAPVEEQAQEVQK
ncbi:MAG: hypothetical protein AB1633_13665 [Elusimicrobiota bacterium]